MAKQTSCIYSFYRFNRRISVGDVLVEFDKDAIAAEGYSIETPVLVTNADDFLDIITEEQKTAEYGDKIITIMHCKRFIFTFC